MSVEKVIDYFKTFGLEDKVMQFQVSSATVLLASIALNTLPCKIAKTLSFDVNGETILIVVAGDAKIDNAKFKQFFHTKAKMLPFDQVEEKTGHKVGGVCPFAVNEDVKTYLDVSLKRFDTVFPACGSDNSAIELTIDQLERYSNSLGFIDVCRVVE